MRAGTWSSLVVIAVLGGAGLVAPQRVCAQAQAQPPAADPTLPAPPPAEPAAAAPAAASGATVYLKNGGFVRGELIELQPGTSARLKLADGTVRDVPWAEIDHIDDPSLPPAPPADGAAPAPELPRAAAPTPAAVANQDEIRRLRDERDDIDNTGPALMMILGGGATLFIGFPGLIVLAASDVCDDDSSDDYVDNDCDDARRAGAVMTVIGVVGAGVAVWGLIKVQQNRRERARLDRRIRDLKGEAALSVDLYPRKEGLSLGLTLRM